MMNKKMLCVLLALLLCPMMAMAEESAAGMLTSQELTAWAQGYIARAYQEEPKNVPAEHHTSDGYEYVYDFATLYADTPILGEDTTVSAIVLTTSSTGGPRGVNVGSAMTKVLEGYYSENPQLEGSRESAVLYAVDNLPEGAAWGQVFRDGQRVQTIQYGVHDQLAARGEGYSDMGVIYTMVENRVSAVRVYGLNSRATRDEVSQLMYSVMLAALDHSYAMVPFSYDGAQLLPFEAADLLFSGVDFLALTPDEAIALLGEPVSDTWMDNGKDGYIRVQNFAACELTYLFNKERTEGSIYMLYINADGMEGPRAVRVGDTFSSVYNRFRNGGGEYQDDGSEMLYGVNGEGSFGKATYGDDASATLRYGFMAEDGRQVVLQLHFTVMELTEIMLYAE